MTRRLTILLSLGAAAAIVAVGLTMTVVDDGARAVRTGEGSQQHVLRRAATLATSHGIDSSFMAALMNDPATTFDSSLVRINVTNFAKRPDYSHNYNAFSVQKAKAFLAEHDSLLRSCERRYGVSRHVIAAILWVETKYGRYTGNHHLPSVYLSVALASDSTFIERNVETVVAGRPMETSSVDSVRKLIQAKAERKALWAIDQLRALEWMSRTGRIDVHQLRGSWAGAFGLSQFIPSSFQRWARDGDGDGDVDLFDITDAAHSVANYLRENGWSDTEASRRAAVYHYNNSNDYVDAVLTLAKKSE